MNNHTTNKYDLKKLILIIRYISHEIQVLNATSTIDMADMFHIEILQGSFWHWMDVLMLQENITMQKAIEFVNGRKKSIVCKTNNKYDLKKLILILRYFSQKIQSFNAAHNTESKLDEVNVFIIEVLQINFKYWMDILMSQEKITMQKAIELLIKDQRVMTHNKVCRLKY